MRLLGWEACHALGYFAEKIDLDRVLTNFSQIKQDLNIVEYYFLRLTKT